MEQSHMAQEMVRIGASEVRVLVEDLTGLGRLALLALGQRQVLGDDAACVAFFETFQTAAQMLRDRAFVLERAREQAASGLPPAAIPPILADPLELAQELCWLAFACADADQIAALARQALLLCPDRCADAYTLLAGQAMERDEYREALTLYEKGIAAGRAAVPDWYMSALPADVSREDDEPAEAGGGERTVAWWLQTETRPYLRACLGAGMAAWRLGRHKKATSHFRYLLVINPNDNQGARYLLATCLLEAGDVKGYFAMRRLWLELLVPDGLQADEQDTFWLYPLALALFLRDGPTAAAEQALAEALSINRSVPGVFARGEAAVAAWRNVRGRAVLGSVEEARDYARLAWSSWARAPEALAWLTRHGRGRKAGARQRA